MLPIDRTEATADPAEYEFPVSPAQAGLLMLDLMHTGSAQYHVPAAFAVHGPFDLAAFTRALDALVARHESLRTGFRTSGGEPVQVVVAEARVPVRVVRGTPADEVDAALRTDAARPFDLTTGPLLRCTVHVLDDGSHRVLLTVHHLVCDGWSMQIMLRELAAEYRSSGSADPPPVQYPDYAVWQRDRLAAGGYADAVAYWRERLRDAPTAPVLPTDRPRPAVQSTTGGIEVLVLPADLRRRLAEVGRRRDTTAFAVLFAAFTAFLGRLSGQSDLVVGVPVAGRDHPDVQGTVGMLANMLAVRTTVRDTASFHDLVDHVRGLLRDAGPHQAAPLSAVVDALAPDRQASHDPVVQVVFNYDDDTELELDLPGARVDRVEVPVHEAKFDFLMQVERRGAGLVAQFVHRTDLFAPATVRHWVRGFRVLLDGLLDRPDAPVVTADLVDPDDRHRILVTWNRTAVTAPATPVPDLVAERAAERPTRTALVCGDVVLTYRDLITRADRLARAMAAAGVGPEVPVALCLPRSAEMAVAALAVLRAGGAYIPLDPDQPPTRLRSMLADAGARLVLATAATRERTDGLGVPVAVVAAGATGFAAGPADIGAPPAGTLRPDNTAYILFTSGSTGTPKGVAVTHRALTNLATAVRPRFPVTDADRVLQYVAFGFDVAVSDLFFTWVAGAELHIAGEHERLGDALHARLGDSRITYAFLPPSAAMSLPCPPDALPDLRTLAVGGEPCPAELVDRWWTARRRVVDAYGPAEAAVYSTTADLRPGEPVLIGRPVPNARAYVLDRRLRPVPVGVVGEIYMAGAGLARGYANRPGPTAERFVADPFGPAGSRMYRTGDLGRWDAGGDLAYLGRVDDQVKVRGFRVELGEIETVLAGHPRVTVAAARVVGDAGDRRLAAYVVAAPGPTPGVGELRSWLADRLPGYMVPENIVHLDELPTGRTGKVDRARLPEPTTSRPELGHPYVAPRTPTEHRLVAIWAGVLRLDRIGTHDNFFDLGGNSILLLTVLTTVREQCDDGITMVDLFRHPTVATLARRLDDRSGSGPSATGTDRSQRHGRDRRERLAARTGRARGRTDSGKGDTA